MDLATIRRRAEILAGVRSFFARRGYTEVDTPLLAGELIPEPAIEVFRVAWRSARDALERELYLVPSPELWMKRLLAEGSGDIFEICHCFRNVEEQGPHHAAEFSMLEWYTLGASYLESLEVTQDLLRHLGFTRPVERASVSELFQEHASIDLAPLDTEASIRKAAADAGLSVSAESDWEECFNKLFLSFVEPELARRGAVFVLDYPASIPTLARRKGLGPFAERWELYIDGVELANCYSEETDRETLRGYLARETARKAAALVPHEPDRLLAELDLPACSGVALGLDRLAMVLLGLRSIEQVIFYPGFGILKAHQAIASTSQETRSTHGHDQSR